MRVSKSDTGSGACYQVPCSQRFVLSHRSLPTAFTISNTHAPATRPTRALSNKGSQRGQQRADSGYCGGVMCRGLNPMVQGHETVRQDAATHQEHRHRAGHRQGLHEPGCGQQNAPAQDATRAIPSLWTGDAGQMQPGVVQLDNAGNQAVHPDGHQEGDADQYHQLSHERRGGHRAEGNRDDLRREHEVGAHGTLDLVLLGGHRIRAGSTSARTLSVGCASFASCLRRNLCASFSQPS
jgi:hypothetical protein